MLTPQDILDKKFEKATFGGYDMSLVDDFLERLSEDYTALYKENAILKSKLKVLVEKVEEYRSTEDSMRMALLTAQKMAKEIIEEAKQKGEASLTEINEQAERRKAELEQQLAVEEARLAEAERKTGVFSARVLALIAEEKSFIEQLHDFTVATPHAGVNPIPQAPATAAEPVGAPNLAAVPMESAATDFTTPPVVVEEDLSLEEMESSVGAYLAQEVSRMTAESAAEDNAPFVEDADAQTAAPQDPFEHETKVAEDVDFFKMFDQDHMTAPAEKPAPQAAAAEPQNAIDAIVDEKINIARSISSALGDTEEIKVDVDAFYDDEGAPTTKRPRFDFDDLQFGTNFNDDEV